jgi:hypothetical protein
MTVIGKDIISIVTGGALELKGATQQVGHDIISIMTGGAVESSDVFANTTLDTKIAAAILKILNKLGKWLLLSAWPDSEYDPTTGKATQHSASRQTVKGIPPFPYEDKYIDGDLIRVGDVQTGIGANGLSFVPQLGHIVSFDQADWKIVRIGPIYSGERIALYMLHLRK